MTTQPSRGNRPLETGLVVTYIRVFTKGKNYTPLPDKWVSSEHRDLHEFLFDRRHRYDAHIDRRQTGIPVQSETQAMGGSRSAIQIC